MGVSGDNEGCTGSERKTLSADAEGKSSGDITKSKDGVSVVVTKDKSRDGEPAFVRCVPGSLDLWEPTKLKKPPRIADVFLKPSDRDFIKYELCFARIHTEIVVSGTMLPFHLKEFVFGEKYRMVRIVINLYAANGWLHLTDFVFLRIALSLFYQAFPLYFLEYPNKKGVWHQVCYVRWLPLRPGHKEAEL